MEASEETEFLDYFKMPWAKKFMRQAEVVNRVKVDRTGPAGKCERNVFSYLQNNPELMPVVGYINEHGNWIYHLWVYDPRTKQHIETCDLSGVKQGARIGMVVAVDRPRDWMDLNRQLMNKSGARY